MFVINKKKGEVSSLSTKEISGYQIKALSSNLAQKVLFEIGKKKGYPMEIARKLRENEQKVYYHIRNLEKSKIIQVVGNRDVQGANANIYDLVEPSFVIRFKEFETTQKLLEIDEPNSFLEPFIESGKLNARIIVGSPDPHGPQKARSRDGYYGIDLALFFGTFLNYVPQLNVRLDTETRVEDLQDNLIVIGGPIVNTINAKINKRLPIRFDENDNLNIISTLSGKKYMNDEAGIIVKSKNPFNRRKSVLAIAGKRHSGTRAVMIAFLRYYNEIIKGNKHNNKVIAKVVEGVDLDSDGIVDDIEILE